MPSTILKTFNAFHIFKIIAASAVSTAVVLALVGGSSYAQTESENGRAAANVLKVSPLRTDVSADPGEAKVVKVTVTNPTDKKVGIRIIQNDFIAGDESGTPAIILEEDEYADSHSLKRFMIPVDDITLGANESRTVDVELVIPANAEPGGYFGVVRFAPTDPDTGGQVNTSASVASLILLTVNGDAPEKLDVTEFQVLQNGRQKTFYVNGEGIQLTTRFQNKGNVQAGPFGKISVLKGNELVYDVDFNSENPRDVVLPNSARRWNIALEQTTGFGKYTVMATFTYGKDNKTVEVSDSFWVIPRNTIIAGLVGLLLLIAALVGSVLFFRKRNDSMNRTFGSNRRR